MLSLNNLAFIFLGSHYHISEALFILSILISFRNGIFLNGYLLLSFVSFIFGILFYFHLLEIQHVYMYLALSLCLISTRNIITEFDKKCLRILVMSHCIFSLLLMLDTVFGLRTVFFE